MKLGLQCTENMEMVLRELLATRNIGIDQQAGIYINEAGCEIPRGKIAILFEPGNLGRLIELLDKLSRIGDDSSTTIVGRTGEDSYQIIGYSQIYYFEARGNNVFCITAGAARNATNEFRIKEKLYELEARLPRNRFVRVGKSYVVNINNVTEIIPWFGRRLILRFSDGKKEIEVSRNYVKNLKEFLGM